MTVAPSAIPNVDAGVDIEVQGSLLLDAFGVVMVKGSFKLQLGTVIGLGSDDAVGGTANTPAADTTYQAMVLTLGEDAFVGAQPVQVFIGVGGELEDNPVRGPVTLAMVPRRWTSPMTSSIWIRASGSTPRWTI